MTFDPSINAKHKDQSAFQRLLLIAMALLLVVAAVTKMSSDHQILDAKVDEKGASVLRLHEEDFSIDDKTPSFTLNESYRLLGLRNLCGHKDDSGGGGGGGGGDDVGNPTLSLHELSPSQLNPIRETIQINLSGGASFDNDPTSYIFTLNDYIGPVFLTITSRAVIAEIPLQEGFNTISFQGKLSDGTKVQLNEYIWAGNSEVTIKIMNDDGTVYTAETIDIQVQLSAGPQPPLQASATTTTGIVVFNNVPSHTILLTALRQSTKQILVSTGFYVTTNTAVTKEIFILGFGTPSDVDNNDFTQGVDGWNIAPTDNSSVFVASHEEAVGPAYNGPATSTLRFSGTTAGNVSNHRERASNSFGGVVRKLGFFDTSLEDMDMVVFTDGIDNDARSVSRVFDSAEGTTMVHIRYRFVTSEVPNGFFGSEYNDYFTVQLRSLKRNGVALETASMNGLGLAAFDIYGSTSWRYVFLPVDPTGDVVAVDVVVANMADGFLDSLVIIDFVEEWDCPSEEVLAVAAVGFVDAWKAGKTIANDASTTAESTGLPGLRNGPADAFRHCYWSCRMAQEIGTNQAEEVGTIHERCAVKSPADEIAMDLTNNAVGRQKATTAADAAGCQSSCLAAVDNGELMILN